MKKLHLSPPEFLSDIQHAVHILKQGGLVAMPTETVYGLAADASNIDAIKKVFTLKGRPAEHPVIVHIGDKTALTQFARDVPAKAQSLIDHFWPGPLTLVFKKMPQVADIITGRQDTVAVRMPAHPVAQALLKAFGALIAPSANRYGRISPTQKAHVVSEFGNAVFVLEGGASEIGIESTILDVSTAPFTLLRQGMIKKSELESVLGDAIIEANAATTTRAPGMKQSHYAPVTPLILAAREEILKLIEHDPDVAVIVHTFQEKGFFSLPNDPAAYAHALYSVLRQADQLGRAKIIVERPEGTEAWLAILDRLNRAACKN